METNRRSLHSRKLAPKKLVALILSALFLQLAFLPAGYADLSDKEGAIGINFFWNAKSDFSKMTWITREVEVTQSAQTTYFSIIGNWTPPFYLGIQQGGNDAAGKPLRNAIFSAWDTYENNSCTDCAGDNAPIQGRTTIKELGAGVRAPGRFGNEGTGVNSFIDNFDWKVGDKVKAVVNLREVSDGTEISAAIQLRDEPWRYFATYKYVKKFQNLEPGYSFIEDFWKSPTFVRSAEYSNTWMENEDLSSRVEINSVGARANTGLNTPYHLISQKNKNGHWAQTGGTQYQSKQELVTANLEISSDLYIPVEARIAALNLSTSAQSDYRASYLKWETDRKALAALKAQKEIEAKAAAELKAKLDAEINAYGDLDGYAIYFDPSQSEYAGFLERYKFNYNLKRLTIDKSAPDTTFTVVGSYGVVPTFSGGLAETISGKRQAYLTVVNLDDAICKEVACQTKQNSSSWNVKFIQGEVNSQLVQHSWGMDIFNDSFAWNEGDEISWLTMLAPEKSSSLLSVAIKIADAPWRHFATVRYPATYAAGLAGGYGSISQISIKTPFTPRSMTLLPTIMTNYSGDVKALTSLYLLGPEKKNRHEFKVVGSSLFASVGIAPQVGTKSTYRLQLEQPSTVVDFSEGKSTLQKVTDSISNESKASRLLAEAAVIAKQVADAKAAAELKAKQDAEAKLAADKAAAELKAKQEAEAKVAADKLAAELKAKQDAEANVAADKLAAELKAKQEAEAKAAKIIADAKIAAAKKIATAKAAAIKAAAAKAAAAKKAITVNCVKGTSVRTFVAKSCPTGWKKK